MVVAANLYARSDVVVDKADNTLVSSQTLGEALLEVRKETHGGKDLEKSGEIGGLVIEVVNELLERRIGEVKSTTVGHVHDDVGHTRRCQFFDVERAAPLRSHAVNHLLHFHQDPRLHRRPLTKSKPLQDGQTQLVTGLECGVVMTKYNSCPKKITLEN